MATARKAFTSEYNFRAAPEAAPERVRRTRQRPQVNKPQTHTKQESFLTPANLRTIITAVIIISLILIGMVVINAQSAKVQYSINQLKSQNALLESEVSMLKVKVERETSIEKLEEYAINKLGMFYPVGSQCVHVATLEQGEGSLVDMIKEKAYE